MYQNRVQVNFQNINLTRQRVKHLANVLLIDGCVFELNQVVSPGHNLILNLDDLGILQYGEFIEQLAKHFSQYFIISVFQSLVPAD